MSSPDIDLALVGRLLRRRWRMLVALALLGGLLGLGASFVLPPRYVSTSKVLLLGDRNPDQLPSEAQIATSLLVLDRAAGVLGWGLTGRDLQDRVTAAVDGTVIEMTGSADTPQRAQELTERVTGEYIAFSAQILSDGAAAVADSARQGREAVQRRITEANETVRRLRGGPDANQEQVRREIARAQEVATQATEQLRVLEQGERPAGTDRIGAASTTLIERATLPTGPAWPTRVHLVAGGALVLVLAGILGYLVRLRADRRLWDPQETAAALGAPVLQCVEVPERRSGRAGRRAAWRDDRSWVGPATVPAEDPRTRRTRYQRVLARAGQDRAAGTQPWRLVVVTVAGDGPALAAVVELVLAAGASGRPASLATGDAETAAAVGAAAQKHGLSHRVSAGPAPARPAGSWAFDLVTVALPGTTMVADPGTGPRAALVVVTAGTRTGLDLATVATACADAGLRTVGVLVALPRLPDRGDPPPAGPVAVPEDTVRTAAAPSERSS